MIHRLAYVSLSTLLDRIAVHAHPNTTLDAPSPRAWHESCERSVTLGALKLEKSRYAFQEIRSLVRHQGKREVGNCPDEISEFGVARSEVVSSALGGDGDGLRAQIVMLDRVLEYEFNRRAESIFVSTRMAGSEELPVLKRHVLQARDFVEVGSAVYLRVE
jgi:hypothetical protein